MVNFQLFYHFSLAGKSFMTPFFLQVDLAP